MKKVIIVLVMITIVIFLIFHKNESINYISEEIKLADAMLIVNPSTWVAVDGLGREIPNNEKKSSDHYRAVGVFYWTWHLGNNGGTVMNVNNINKANPDKKNDWTWWTNNYATPSAYWWNEPIYGYYMENDDYVLRKQAELLADAGVDFVVFDCTNGTALWEDAYHNLLRVWKEAQDSGINVPRIAFMLQFTYSNDTYTSFMNLYNDLYNPNSTNYKKYHDLIYTFNGKPLLLAHTEKAPVDMKNLLKNFEVRAMDGTYFLEGAKANGNWGWLSAYPQAYYLKANKNPEQISVGVAQNANYATNTITAMNGSNVMGRSYAKGNYSYNYQYRGNVITVGSSISGSTAKSTNTSLYGRNFQQQWDYAISIDPEIVFVTGWNEWIMGRFEEWGGVKNAFPDEFNDEYSRDIEPSKGELKDYYYYQLVANIRKYKGISSQKAQNTPVTINNTSDWNNGNILSYNHYTGGKNRNVKGYGVNKTPTYANNTFRNDIKKAKVSYDNSYIYFYVETTNNISNYNSDKWMRLLIDTKSSTVSSTDNWEEFEYIVNRISGSTSTLVLEKSNGGWNFSKVGDVSYKVSGKALEIKIPREYLGQTSNNISFNFKWCDNNLNNGDIMSIYTDGDSAPGGRFAFHFEGDAPYKKITISKNIVGDINGDGKVNSNDYILIRKHILGIKLTGDNLKSADVNSDNIVNSKDYIAIRKIIIGIK